MTEQATIATADDAQQRPEAAAADALSPPEPVGAHLVGSVPLGSVEEVFRRTAERARRPPAPAARRRARPAVGLDPLAVPGLQRAAAVRGRPARRRTRYRTLPKLRLRDGERAEDIVLDNLGFADAAIVVLRHLRQAQARRGDPGARALPGLAADAAGAGQRVHRPRAPGRRSSRSTRRACCASSTRSSPPCRTTSSRCSGTRGWSSRSSRASARPGSTRTRAGVLERLLRVSRARARGRRARLPPLLRRRLPRPLHRARRHRASSSRSPTRSRPRCTGR